MLQDGFRPVPLPSPRRRRTQEQESSRYLRSEQRGTQYVLHSPHILQSCTSACYARNVLTLVRAGLSYPARLRALFWIALTNFVVPVIFNVVLLIFVPNEDFGNIITVFAVGSVSVYVQIVSGLLATLWCTSTFTQARGPDPMLTLKFVPASALNLRVLTELDSVNTSSSTESSGPC